MNPMGCSLLPVLLVAAVTAAFAAATGIAMLLLTASLMAILAALRAAILPYRRRQNLQRPHGVRRIVAGDDQVTGARKLVGRDVADDDANA